MFSTTVLPSCNRGTQRVKIIATETMTSGKPMSNLPRYSYDKEADLELDWQDEVVTIITQAPVKQILRVLTYMPSSSVSMPITFLQSPVELELA